MSDRKLSARQKRFVDEYMLDHNGTQAAIRAGYSEATAKQTAYRVLRYEHVAAEIAEREKERRLRLGLDADWIVQQLVTVYEKSLVGAPRTSSTGKLHYATDDDGNRFAISDWSPSGANKALELLMKHLGIAPDRHELEIVGDVVYTLEIDRDLGEDADTADPSGVAE